MKNSITKLLALVMVLAMTVGLVACGAGSGKPAENSAAPENSGQTETNSDTPDTFKLGSLTSTAGALALLCECESIGIKMAVEDINAAGGLNIDGKTVPVTLTEYDVGTDPNTQMDYAQRLVSSDGVKVINGLMNSGTMANQLEITNPAKAIVYNYVGSPAVLPTSDYGINFSDTGVIECHSLMEVFGEDDAALEAAGLPVEQIRSAKRVAVFGMNEAYTQLAALGLEDGCEKYGMEFVGSVMFPTGTTDFLSYITALKQLDPDVVMINTYSNDTMIPPLRDMLQVGGLDWTKGDIILMGNDVMATDAFIASAAEQGVDVNGAICFTQTPDEVTTAYTDFTKRVVDKYGASYESLISYVWGGYETTMYMFKAMETAGTVTDTDAIMDAVNSMKYQSLLSEWSVTDGQASATEFIRYNADGKANVTGLHYSDVLVYGNALKYPF